MTFTQAQMDEVNADILRFQRGGFEVSMKCNGSHYRGNDKVENFVWKHQTGCNIYVTKTTFFDNPKKPQYCIRSPF